MGYGCCFFTHDMALRGLHHPRLGCQDVDVSPRFTPGLFRVLILGLAQVRHLVSNARSLFQGRKDRVMGITGAKTVDCAGVRIELHNLLAV